MRRPFASAALALVLLVPSALSGAEPPPKPAPKPSLRPRLDAETLKLPNGMTFILAPRQGAPVFTGYIGFKAGGVDNVPGETGMAHMFEHMAFKGTEHIGTTDWPGGRTRRPSPPSAW